MMYGASGGNAQRSGHLAGLPAAALLAGLVFLFQPAQVYQYNSPFFPIGLKQFAPLLVPMFLAAFALLAALMAIGRPLWRQWSAAAIGGLAMAAWAASTFFTASRGILDGRSVLLIAGPGESALNAVAFLAVAAGSAYAAHRWPGQARRLFLAFFAVLSVHAMWVAATDSKPWQEDSAPRYGRLATLSGERNVLVFILDSFQSDFLAEIVAREPSLAGALEGFTYFPNAVSPAPTTYLAMPAIHSGGHFVEGDNIRGLYDRTVVNNSFVSRLSDAGYDAMLVNNVFDWCPRATTCALSDHMTDGRAKQVVRATALMLNLSVFRMVPDVAKKAIYRGGAWWIPEGMEMDIVQSSNGLLDRLAADLHGGLDKPSVRFFHLFSSHAPVRVDADCRPVQGAPWVREHAIAQGRCALRKVEAVLATLKGKGLYDASAIVILADHGTGMAKDSVSGFNLGASASPLLMVKPFGARGDLRSSTRVVGLADVPATVCTWTGACKADWGVDVMASADRPSVYPFVEYTWQGKFFGAKSLPVTNRYEIRGSPHDVESWWRLTNVPAGTVRELAFATSDPPGAFGFGWSALETSGDRDFRWAVGSVADVYLDLDESVDARLLFDVSTLPGNAGQVMAVEVNGEKVGEVAIRTARAVHEVVVPARAIRKGADRILLRFTKANSPGTTDPRRLAVLFDNLAMQQPAGPQAGSGEASTARSGASKPLRVIERLEFSKSDPPEAFGFGWSDFEASDKRDWRWAVGAESELHLNLRASSDARLKFEVSTIGINAGQVMSVEVNGVKVGEVPVDASRTVREVMVPARVIREGSNRVLLRFAKANLPGTTDPRRLAVLFDNLAIQQPRPAEDGRK